MAEQTLHSEPWSDTPGEEARRAGTLFGVGTAPALQCAGVLRPALFLDDGGVMNENTRRGLQWQRLVGRYFVPRLGGVPEAWAAANAEVAARLFREYEAYFGADPAASWTAYWAGYEADWLGGMCAAVGVAPPPDRATRLRLVRECDHYVTRRVRAAVPGAVGAIRQLHAAGYTLRTASGEASWELHGYLTGMRVRGCFVALYGPDQVDTAKAGPLFYARVFAHAAIPPGGVLVVDDSERALGWAAEVGARTVLCRPEPPANPRHLHVRTLAQLPSLLACWTAHTPSAAHSSQPRGAEPDYQGRRRRAHPRRSSSRVSRPHSKS